MLPLEKVKSFIIILYLLVEITWLLNLHPALPQRERVNFAPSPKGRLPLPLGEGWVEVRMSNEVKIYTKSVWL